MSREQLHIGMAVHYVSHGSADGVYPRTCRAATITEIREGAPGNVSLVVHNPTGTFFHSLADGGCDQEEPSFMGGQMECVPTGGTWHRVHSAELTHP